MWLSGETYTDTENLMTFYVRKFDNEIKVMRTDANAGWNIDLTFKCCSKGLYKMIQALSLRFLVILDMPYSFNFLLFIPSQIYSKQE